MKSLLLIILVLEIMLFTNCTHNQSHSNISDSLLKKDVNGSPYNKQTVDSMIRAGAISPDSVPDLPPTQDEERERIKKEYDNINFIDTVFITGSDTLHFHSKFYCLKNRELVVPNTMTIKGKMIL